MASSGRPKPPSLRPRASARNPEALPSVHWGHPYPIRMFKTILVLGFLALAALLALKLLLAILGAAVGLAVGLLALVFPALLLGALVYFILLVFAPERAAALRARFGGA